MLEQHATTCCHAKHKKASISSTSEYGIHPHLKETKWRKDLKFANETNYYQEKNIIFLNVTNLSIKRQSDQHKKYIA